MFLAVTVRGKTHRDRAAIAHGAARLLEQFAHQTHAVLERAAVFVGAAVQAAREEFRHEIAVTRIDVDDVEAGLACPQRRLAVPTLELANVAPVHALGLPGVDARRRRAHAERGLSARQVRHIAAAVPELDAGERPVRMHRLGHRGEIAEVAVIPKRGERVGMIIRAWMNRAVLGADNSPAALRFHCAHRDQRLRQRVAHARAMRHLI